MGQLQSRSSILNLKVLPPSNSEDYYDADKIVRLHRLHFVCVPFIGRDVAQAVEHSPVKVRINICSLGYFQFQSMVPQLVLSVGKCI